MWNYSTWTSLDTVKLNDFVEELLDDGGIPVTIGETIHFCASYTSSGYFIREMIG